MILYVERLRDFLCLERLHDFSLSLIQVAGFSFLEVCFITFYSKGHFFTSITDGRTNGPTTRLLELLRAAKNNLSSVACLMSCVTCHDIFCAVFFLHFLYFLTIFVAKGRT